MLDPGTFMARTLATRPSRQALRDYFYFIENTDLQKEVYTERKILHPLLPKPGAKSHRPGGCSRFPMQIYTVQRLWPILHCFPSGLAGIWTGSGAARTCTDNLMRSQCLKDEHQPLSPLT